MTSPTSPNFLDQPIVPPPPGQVSNFVDPPSIASGLYITTGVCLSLILLFATLRFYAKFKILKRGTWDDATCVVGVICGISFICMTTAAVAGGGYGSHTWDIKKRVRTKNQLVLSLIAEIVYGPCIWAIKLSLFVLYLEVFKLVKWLRYCAYAGMNTTGSFYFAAMILFSVLCAPRNGQSQMSYLSALASPRCTESHGVVLSQGIINIISDLYLIALPLPALWSLQMPLRRKFGVAAMISTGLIACIASILGLVYRVKLIWGVDNAWNCIPVWITSIVEMTAGIIVCCTPMANNVWTRIKGPIGSFFWSSTRGFSFLTIRMTSSKHEHMGITSNLRPDLETASYQAQVVSTDRTVPLWFNSSNDSGDWPYDHGRSSPLDNIRKTTDIEIA